MIFAIAFICLTFLHLSNGGVCHFDASCSCSSPPPHLGQVQCINTPVTFNRINSTRIFSFALINNNIDYLPCGLFAGTGLYSFHFSQNWVYQLEEDVFNGVERSLWELHLTYCKLTSIPSKAVWHLQKLKILNLSGNAIGSVTSDDLKGVSATLQVLILADNRISVLQAGSFSVLQSLTTLDLRGNVITTLEPAAFTPPPPKLMNLDLSDNHLTRIDFKQLAIITSLSTLDMSYNFINDVIDKSGRYQLILDSLSLDFNNITRLETNSFSNFGAVNKTSLRGNPLTTLEARAFQPCAIEELYLCNCKFHSVNPDALIGLSDSLKILDLSGNYISTFEFPVLSILRGLKSLKLDYNQITDYNWISSQNHSTSLSLSELSVLGGTNAPITLKSLPRLPHLNTLAISKTPSDTLDPDHLAVFSVELENLKLENSPIKRLKNGMFQHVRGIKTLDLTDNSIDSIDAFAFVEISHSLEKLILTNALSKKIDGLPFGLLKPLTSLTVLKLNHNKLRKLPSDLQWMSSLKILHAHDNLINHLPNYVFESNTHKGLEEIILSFNKIPKIVSGTFSDLSCLLRIDLSDNDVVAIETGAFKNLPAIKYISFRGNKLTTLQKETFQNLPFLEVLDTSYNSIVNFNMAGLDQVGTLGNLCVNVSHNSISVLRNENQQVEKDYSTYGTIKVLDFSHNQIKTLEKNYFAPIQDSLVLLALHHNSINNLSRDALTTLPQLQYLDLSSNVIDDIEFDSFRHIPLLQTVLLGENKLKTLPTGLFTLLTQLNRLDISHNRLTSLPDSLLSTTSPIFIDMSHNRLSGIPLNSFLLSSASHVQELILKNNTLTKLPSSEAFARLSGLRHLDISQNQLTELGNSLVGLTSLAKLIVSYNRIRFDTCVWKGQEGSLKHLDLTNTSLTYVPPLPFPSLLTLKFSNNGIAYIPPELQANLTSLKLLDISNNILPELLTAFPQVVTLNLANNPMHDISNSTFDYFTNLAELDIRKLPLTTFDVDGLTQLRSLTALSLNNYKLVEHFNVPLWIKGNHALRQLTFEVIGSASIDGSMKGGFPPKIRHITLEGLELKSIPNWFLKGFESPELHLSLKNTSVEILEQSLFRTSYLRNVSLHFENSKIKTVQNPSNAERPNVPHSVFLINMRLNNPELTCDCKIGWIETWLRKKRQWRVAEIDNGDLRVARCKNKQGKSLMSILKTELECGWSRATNCAISQKILITLTLIIVAFTS